MSFWEWLAALGGLSAGWWVLGYFMGHDAARRRPRTVRKDV